MSCCTETANLLGIKIFVYLWHFITKTYLWYLIAFFYSVFSKILHQCLFRSKLSILFLKKNNKKKHFHNFSFLLLSVSPVEPGHHQQHHHSKHDFHQNVAEVWSVGRQPSQHRLRPGLLHGAAAAAGESQICSTRCTFLRIQTVKSGFFPLKRVQNTRTSWPFSLCKCVDFAILFSGIHLYTGFDLLGFSLSSHCFLL